MWLPRRHERRRRRHVDESEIDGHAELLGDGGEGGEDVVAAQTEAVEVELDTLEEDGISVAGAGIDMLLGVHDVALVIGEELGGCGNDAGLVRAREQQDGGHGHRSTCEFRGAVDRGRSRRLLRRQRH